MCSPRKPQSLIAMNIWRLWNFYAHISAIVKEMNHGSIITTQFEPTTCTLINIRVFGEKQSIKIFNGTLKKWVEVITRQMLHSKLQHLTEGRISNIISVGDFSSSVINLTSGSRETSEFASSYWFYNYVHVLERHWV